MSNTFVVTGAQILDNPCRTVLGFRNVLSESIATGAFADPNYPLSSAFDDSYQTEYAPNSPSSVTMIFSLSSPQAINYFCLCSKNAGSCGLAVLIEVSRASALTYATASNFGSMTDGKPVMVYFGDIAGGVSDVLKLRVTLSYTSKPYIMSMLSGNAIVFPRTMSTGFQPAFAAYLDEVEQFYADDGLNLTMGRRLARGKQMKGSINFVKMSTIKTFWDEYANHVLNSKPLCLLWNTQMPDECIYGVQVPDRLTKPTYKNPKYSQVDFEIIGWA